MYDTLYIILLAAHNILRWVIVGLAIFTLYQSYSGWIKKSEWKASEQKAGTYFTIALDTQLVVGLILYVVLSPMVKTVFMDFGAAMKNATLRFFGIEHLIIMVAAIAVAHVANSQAKKEMDSQRKFRLTAILYTIAILLVVAGIPWTTRPLIPFI